MDGLIIAGDFNYPNIEWCNLGGISPSSSNRLSIEFLETINSNFLIQHVIEPTFAKNILDLVVSDDPAGIYSIEHGPPLGISSKNRLHSTLYWKYQLKYYHEIPMESHTELLTNPKWFINSIKKLSALKYKLHCRLRVSPLNKDLEIQYKNQCGLVKTAVCANIFAYKNDFVDKCKSNPKLLYSYVNSQTSCREKIKFLIDKSF